MRGVTICGCPECGWRGFPHRAWCPRCGCFETQGVVVDTGSVEESTTVHRATGRPRGRPVTLGSVVVEGGTRIIVRLESAGAGDEVCLDTEANAFVGRRMQHAKCDDAVSD